MSRSTSTAAFTAQERNEIVEQFGRFVTKKQAAQLTASSERTIGRQIEAGLLSLYRVGRSRTLRLKTAEVLALLERVS